MKATFFLTSILALPTQLLKRSTEALPIADQFGFFSKFTGGDSPQASPPPSPTQQQSNQQPNNQQTNQQQQQPNNEQTDQQSSPSSGMPGMDPSSALSTFSSIGGGFFRR